ncbi:hypothetical protein D5086_014732 [Populus alba]|uniref:Uncharacterized protein n=1 Tax=Populus alba TaxID=43335 RepID=A0ACC4C059_POPAL
MLFNSLSPSAKPILYPLEICNRQDRLFLFPKPATPSQKLLSTGVSPLACAKLPSNCKTQRHFVFPEKISAAVFAAAVMPGPDLSFKAIAEKSSQASVSYMDTQYVFGNGPDNPPTAVVLGPNYMASRFYHLSPPETFPIYSGLETERAAIVTKEKYGSVRRIYIVCDQEKDPRQAWMIENNPVDEVMVISGSDHMAMFSKPQELCSCLLEIGDKYMDVIEELASLIREKILDNSHRESERLRIPQNNDDKSVTSAQKINEVKHWKSISTNRN